MTPDRIDSSPDAEPENGVLSDTASIDTTALGILGGVTEQVSVAIPVDEEDDLSDDDVVDDEVAPEAFESLQAEPESTTEGGSEHVIEASLETVEVETADPYRDTATAEWASVEVEEESEAIDPDREIEAEAGFRGEDAHDAPPEPTELAEAIEPEVLHPPAAVPEAVHDEQHIVAEAADEESPAHAGQAAASDEPVMTEVGERTTSLARVQPAHTPVVPPLSPVKTDARAARPEVPASTAGAAQPLLPASVADAVTAGSVPATRTGSVPATRREAMHPELSDRTDRAHGVERFHPNPDVTLASKRLGEFEAGRESSDLLTPDRLLDPHQVVRPEPEGTWQHFVYSLTAHRINLGDGKRARDRKALDRRISVPLTGAARFVPVLSRKGGVGKTTVTTLLGMALADARDDRIIAIDANPDRGTLAERIAKASGKTIRDLVKVRADVAGYSDISSIVARDETRLDVLASDADPRVSEALNDHDYYDVASLAAHYYSIVLTDTGTGIVHSVMGATLDVADQLVIVSGLSVDEARLASETLTWLETNGYSEQARNAVVVLNSARPGAPLVRQEELEAHFGTRVRTVVRMPYDPLIAAGSAITFRDLQPATRLAARELAATVVEGLRALAPAA